MVFITPPSINPPSLTTSDFTTSMPLLGLTHMPDTRPGPDDDVAPACTNPNASIISMSDAPALIMAVVSTPEVEVATVLWRL